MENLNDNELQQKVSDFKEVVKTFSELLSTENAALNAYDLDTITALFEKKAKTIGIYRSMIAYFIKNQEALAGLEQSVRNELKEISVRLDNLIKENELLLNTRMETSKNVMNSIINIAKMANNANATSYGAQGKYTPRDNNSNALAINRTL